MQQQAFTFPRGPVHWLGLLFALVPLALAGLALWTAHHALRSGQLGATVLFGVIALALAAAGLAILGWNTWHLADRSPSLTVTPDSLRFHPADGPKLVVRAEVAGWRYTPAASFLAQQPNNNSTRFERLEISFARPFRFGWRRRSRTLLSRIPVGDGNDLAEVANALQRFGY